MLHSCFPNSLVSTWNQLSVRGEGQFGISCFLSFPMPALVLIFLLLAFLPLFPMGHQKERRLALRQVWWHEQTIRWPVMWRIITFPLWSCILSYLSSACTRFGASLPTSKYSTAQPREKLGLEWEDVWRGGGVWCFVTPGFSLSYLTVGQTRKKSISLPPFYMCAQLWSQMGICRYCSIHPYCGLFFLSYTDLRKLKMDLTSD